MLSEVFLINIRAGYKVLLSPWTLPVSFVFLDVSFLLAWLVAP